MSNPSPQQAPLSVAPPSFLPPSDPPGRKAPRVDPSPNGDPTSSRPLPDPRPLEPGEDYGPSVDADRATLPGPSTPASTEPARDKLPEPSRADVNAFHGLIAVGLGLVGLVVASRLARTPEQQQAGVWQIDDDDREDIGRPLARIAARHAGTGNGPGGDTADAVAIAVGVAGYALKNTERARLVDADPWSGQPEQSQPREAAAGEPTAAQEAPPVTWGGLIPPQSR